MPEPEGLLFLGVAAIALGSALLAGTILLLVGFIKKSKAAKVLGGWALGIGILPGLYVGSWVYHWMKGTS